MKVYIVTEKELEELRLTLRSDWLEHCSHFNLDPQLGNDPKNHDYNLFAKFNFSYCRWKSDIGNDHPKDLRT